MNVAGIGCRSACQADELVALVQRAMREASVTLHILAAPSRRADLACVRQAAQRLGLDVRPVSEDSLMAQQGACVTHSARALGLTGLGSVAEAAALAAAGEGARLLLPRIQSAWATCAIAT
jgi:cobalt-precorrin 5A hydrolase